MGKSRGPAARWRSRAAAPPTPPPPAAIHADAGLPARNCYQVDFFKAQAINNNAVERNGQFAALEKLFFVRSNLKV